MHHHVSVLVKTGILRINCTSWVICTTEEIAMSMTTRTCLLLPWRQDAKLTPYRTSRKFDRMRSTCVKTFFTVEKFRALNSEVYLESMNTLHMERCSSWWNFACSERDRRSGERSEAAEEAAESEAAHVHTRVHIMHTNAYKYKENIFKKFEI